MLRMLTAYTFEVENMQWALDDILCQLKLEENLQKNTVGFLQCHSDFIETGVAGFIAGHLPFDVVGGTTMASMTPEGKESLILSISVLTSDEISFHTFSYEATLDITEIEKVYRERLPQENKPKLLVPFFPMLADVAAGEMLTTLDKISDGVPIYGSLVIHHTLDFNECFVIHNDEVFQSKVVIIAMSGELNPRFFVSEVPEKYIQRRKDIITKSKRNTIIEVNDMPVLDYLASIGISNPDDSGVFSALSIAMDLNDGTKPVICGMQRVSEQGHVICSEIMPEKATIVIGDIEYEDVVKLTEDIIGKVSEIENYQGVFLCPCATHLLLVGADIQFQGDIIKSHGLKEPYHLWYAGGEICPVYDEEGKIHNHCHAYSYTACVF